MAVSFAGDVFLSYDRKGLSKGLAGTPKYTISGDRSSGSFKCYVASKDLSAADVEKFFSWLSATAGQGKKPTASGPAKWDDGPPRPIAGKEATFTSKGRKLRLEAIHFTSEKGPVGAFSVTIDHTVSGS
ncbi:hypothetical protein [Phaeovulum sp. W22_SRMD_FR3]|uniref:hypothetical protein n=1 Tax=Phaeovulum sp. W22_SRMD_FR3 TaxID=3240274 RepID=UPI003F9D8D80